MLPTESYSFNYPLLVAKVMRSLCFFRFTTKFSAFVSIFTFVRVSTLFNYFYYLTILLSVQQTHFLSVQVILRFICSSRIPTNLFFLMSTISIFAILLIKFDYSFNFPKFFCASSPPSI